MSDQNLFLDFLSRDKAMRNQDTALTPGRVNARVGVTAQPVAQTDFGALARRYGVPPAVVENDPDTWRQRAASDDAQRQIDLAPKLGQWLGGDPQRAKMTHDSLDAMAGVEHAISAVFPKNGTDADKLRYWKEHNPGQGSITTPPTTAQVVVAKIRKAMDSLYSGTQSSDVGLYGIAANAMGNLFGDNSAIAQHLRQRAGEKQREAQKYSQASKGGEWEQAIYGGIESLPQALVALGAGVASGGSGSVVVGTAGSLLTAGATVQGQSYITARQAGLSHEEAQAFGQRDAAVEVATELLPTARVFHALKVGTPAMDKLKDWAIATIEEQVGEQFATHLQDLNQWASIDANKGKTLDQYFAERPDAAFRTAVATAIMSGTVGGIIGATNLAQRRRAPAEQQAQKSQRTEALLTGLKELAEAAPIAKRDVSTFENWVKAAAEGTQATDVYIDARTLVETLQQSGLTEPEIVAALPSIRTELPTALLANGDVRIPIEEFAARSGELGQSLIPHLRLDPNDMSTSEAQTFMQSAQDEFQKETEKAFAEINADDQFRQSTERVADAVYEKLNQAGRFTPDTNRAYASLHAAFFARLASDLGTTPEEAAARYPLLIQSEGVGEGPGVMDQPQEADEAAAPQVFDQGERAPPALYPAIRHNGKIYKSVSDHLSALSQIPDPAERAKASADGDNRVYVTERGKVLDRFRAQEYAQAHKLISPDAPSWAHTSPDLISENLRKPGRYYADTPVEGYDQSGQSLPATIEVDGKQRSTVNSNGQPLAQTEEGIRAFWDWFGDSKVVDEQGRPLVVYHGTAADFEAFDPSTIGSKTDAGWAGHGFYFSSDPTVSSAYGGKTVSAYLSAKNLYKFEGNFAKEVAAKGGPRGFSDWLRDNGYDGARLWSQVMVLDPTQIKSIHNRGTFDPNDPRILYQSGQSLPATIEVDGKQRSTVNSNGQPLAQTEEGVRAFWDWFGDSKVVDEQGRPLVVYHGTAADFDIFKNSPSTRHGHGRQMPGIYLTPDPSIAEAYARTAANARDASTEINGAAILPLYVKMENPARFADPEDFANANVVEIKKHGYDGAVRFAPNDGRLLEIVVFDPTQIKSIHNRGTFDPNDPRILYQNGQPIFYSALQRTVESSKQAKAPASQWKSILQNAPGVKAEELEWSGILDLFDEDPKRVWTRDELVQLLDAGGIKVDEVVLGDEDWVEQRAQELYDEAEREALDNASEYVDTSHFSEEVEDEDGNPAWQVYGPYADEDSVFDTEEAAEEAVTEYNDREREDALEYFEFDRSFSEFERMARDEQGTQFQDWSSDPSNDTYRELLITLPIGEGRNPDRAPSTHWDQPNVVAHARFMDKRDASGDRVLFIEEVQSDWHQKGRDQGYEQKVDPAAIEAARQLAEEAEKKLTDAKNARTALWLPLAKKAYEDTLRNADEVSASDEEIRRAQNYLAMLNSDSPRERLLAVEPVRIGASVLPEGAEAADAAVGEARRWTILKEREYNAVMNPSGIPNAPFKSTWPALVMKRMIRWAVDNGYTKIAWTTGEEQADRYDLAATVGTISAWRNGDEVGVELGNYEAQTAFVGQAGSGPYSREQLVEVLGQDLGNRVFDAGLGATYTEAAELEGADLKIGGEGMKAFYDRNLVNITNDLIKKHGVKVGKLIVADNAAVGRAFEAGRGDNTTAVEASIRKGMVKERHGFEINDKLAEAAAGGFPLFQGPRGQIRVGDVTQDPTVITLLQRADLSTFLHESGHFFLEVLMHVAAQPDAPQRVVDDMNAFLKWTGVESMGQWSKMTTNEKREHHERFARGFEAFLYEGNAPSLELKSLFQRFRDWLLTVYRSLTQLNVELDPEVRGIFSRMLASDQAIREAEQQVGYEPILTEKPEGMADEEWEAYQRLGADATSEAVTDLERRSLRDMRYAGKAAGRELKRLQREIRTMRDTMRAEVEADLAREPVYRAQDFMKKGLLDGAPVEGPSKMLLSEVEALYEDRPKLYVDEVKRALGFGQYGMLAKDGIHPEQIAELFGFTSADHMIQDLMLAEPFKKAVETEIDTRMLERYGDITSEKALQDAVDQAIHNDVRGRFVATEFAALSKAPGKPRVMAAAARSLAEKAVSRLKVRNLRPAQYEAAERRAAKAAAEASAKGDIALAASEKRNQLINFYGAKASHDALADVDKMVRYFKKFENKGTRQNLDVGYLDQIDKLLERFDLRKSVTNRQADKRKSLKAWVDRQKEMGFDPLIDEELLDEANRIPYREMTVEEMRGLRDTIRNIEHLARLKKKLLLAKDQREFADAVSDVAGAIRANAYKNVTEIIGAKTWWERVQSGIHDFFAMHRKMANWAHVMDGNKMGGPVWERFIRPMNERGAWEASAKAKATADLGALFDRLKGQNLTKRSFIPAIGKSLSLQDRLMVALNMGNEGNLQRLMDGERWEQDRLNAVLEPLTQEHWAFVQAVWDYLDSFYPEVAAKEVRVSGVAPQKVEAVPFERQLADGSTVQLRGGYFPIKYDPARSSRAEADTAAEVLQQMTQGRYTAAQTRRGHTKARAEQVDRPVRKDFGVIFEHVNQVIHDLAWHEYLIDANRLLRAVDIDTAIREAHGPETLRWMRKALEDIALGDIPAQSSFEQVINHVRAGASVAAMGWNLWTSMMQPLGLTQSASRIGARWVAKGIGRIMGDAAHMESAAQWVYERSEFMRNRGATQQREIAEIRSKVSDKSPLRKTVELAVPAPVADAVADSFFVLIAKAQLIADLPTWIGQYEKSMAAGETEERAAALADQAVLDSQGGGQIKDMAGIQRGGALMKLWTNFYGYFNTTYNLMADRTAQLRREGVRDLPAFAVDQLMLSALPSILTTLLYQLVKGDDDDWGDLPKHMAEDFFGYMTGLMVGLREIGAVLNPNSSYQGPAGARVFSEINKFGKQVQQGEGDEALARSANQLAGILFHYPATQIDRTARGIAALEQGEAGPLAPVVGPPVDR